MTTIVNSQEYWDGRFESNWESCQGSEQSRFFAQLALSHLPSWLLTQINSQTLSVADWGCAQGDGTELMATHLPYAKWVGIDFSSIAIQEARQRYPHIEFYSEDWLVNNGSFRVFDIVYSSNTLEHFHNPLDVLTKLCTRANLAIVLALPFYEVERINEHFYSFLPENIPLVLVNNFQLIWSKVVDCRAVQPSYWSGHQIFLVYVKPAWLGELNLALHNAFVAQDDIHGAMVAMQNLLSERERNILSLNSTIKEKQNQLDHVAQSKDFFSKENDSFRVQLIERDVQVRKLSESLLEQNAQFIELTKTVTERDRQILSLTGTLANLESDLMQLRQEHNQQNDKLNGLNAEIHTYQAKIAQLQQALSAKCTELANFSAQIAKDREGLVADKTNKIAQLEADYANLAVAHEALVNLHGRVLRSRSWLITRPFRLVARVIKHGPQVLVDNPVIYKFARQCNRLLPLPLSIKSYAKNCIFQSVSPLAFQGIAQPDVALSIKPIDLEILWEQVRCQALLPNLVSVILPVYNQAYLLRESIESVLGQTYQNFELIVINDGSQDDIHVVMSEYLDHPKIRFYDQPNQKLPKALSNGFALAKGEFWTWTSADNIMEPKMLELMVTKFRLDPNIGMLYADYYAIDDRGEVLQDRSWRAHNRPKPETGEIRLPRSVTTLNTVQDNFIGPCFMYRGWIGQCIGDYDPQLGIEDYDYWMRINAFFNIQHLDSEDLLYRYRVHDNTLSAQAVEHRILDKVQRLMQYEQERAVYYRLPVNFLADEISAQWLRAKGVDDSQVTAFAESSFEQADILIITSGTATCHLAKLVKLIKPIVILFETEDKYCYYLERLLINKFCLAVVCDAITASRIRLVSDRPILNVTMSSCLTGILAFAKSRMFLAATRTASELHRETPKGVINPSNMRILLQVDSFTSGGMENVVIDLALFLRDKGFLIRILNLGKSGDSVSKAESFNIQVDCLEFMQAEERYKDYLLNNGIQLVNAHYSIFGAQVCHRLNIPFVETIHNSYVWFDDTMLSAYRQADFYIQRYIAVSKTAAAYADMALGLDPKKMLVVENGVDCESLIVKDFTSNRKLLRDAWGVNDNTVVYLNVASIMATKAQFALVKAFAKVLLSRPNAKLVLLGEVMENPYYQQIVEYTKKHKLVKNIIFAGFDRSVAKYYHAADVFVLPSYWEGWSLSLGEAIVSGLPCVISDVGSAYLFTDKANVKLVNPPFDNIINLNHLNLNQYLYFDNPDYEDAIADAMLSMVNMPREPFSNSLAKTIDKKITYQAYAEVFVRLSKNDLS